MLDTPINLLIYLAVWRRPEITELCFMGIERMRKHSLYNIQVLAVISEPEMIPLCNKYNVKWIVADNYPLGKKKNKGLKEASNYDFDYLMEIGSDDLITNDLLDCYIPYFKKFDFFGISDAVYIESENLSCRRLTFTKSTYGAGRCMSRNMLESMNWNIWDDNLQRGLDNNSTMRIETKGYKFNKIPPMDVPGLIDVKSQENLWKFNYFLGEEYDINLLFAKLSESEVNKIISFAYVGA